jgi:hypothetical protein
MLRRGGMKMLREVTEIFSGIKGGGGSESSQYTEGGGYKLFKVLVQQGPGVFTPTVFNRIYGLKTH